jgi:hypothetical protein
VYGAGYVNLENTIERLIPVFSMDLFQKLGIDRTFAAYDDSKRRQIRRGGK